MATFKSNTYDGRYLQLTITETVDAINNQSTLNWTLTSAGGSSNYYTVGTTTITINGTQVYYKYLTEYSAYTFPAAKGSVSGSIVVKHDSDGTKKINVGFSTRVYYWESLEYGGPMDLADIDRTAPTVSFSVSNIVVTGFKISATASTSCNAWDYSLDDGKTWTSFSTKDATSASMSVTGLAVNTSYKVKVRARRTYNYVYGTSPTVTAKTLGHAVVNSCADFYVDAETVKVYPNVTVYNSDFTYCVVIQDNGDIACSPNYKWTSGTANRTVEFSELNLENLLKSVTKTEKEFILTVRTYDEDKFVASSSCRVIVKTSVADSGPQWEYPYFFWEDTSTCVLVTNNAETLIQGYSDLVVDVVDVSARNFANISSYTVTIGEKTIKSSSPKINVGKIETDGVLEMRLTVTDSRGHSVEATNNVTVLKYEPPKINKCTARRANGIDDVIQLSFTATMSVIKPDGENDVNCVQNAFYRYKQTSEGSDYSDDIPIEVVRSSTGTSLSFDTDQLISLDNKYSYDITICIEDRISGLSNHYVIPRGIPAMAIRKDKVGINNPDPQYALDVAGDIGLTGGLFRDGRNVVGDTGWVDLGISDKVSETENKDAGHYDGCAYRVVGDNHVYVAFNVSARITGTAVKVSGAAIPSKYRPVMQPFGFVALNGSRVARVYVNRGDGHVYLDWVHNIADATEPSEHVVTWIDGYIDYWI